MAKKEEPKESPKAKNEARYKPVPKTKDGKTDVRKLLSEYDEEVNKDG